MADPGPEYICLTPLSSPYGLLPRAHTYALVLALLAPLPQGWLFRAALAAFTTRTAVTAIDGAVLLARLRRPHDGEALPLDVLPALEQLALASLVAAWLLVCSARLRQSSARPLVAAWAVFVGIGAILSFVALKLLGRAALTSTEEGVEAHSCPGGSVMLAAADIIGAPVTLSGGLGLTGDKLSFFLLRVGVSGVFFAALAFLAAWTPRAIGQPRATTTSVYGADGVFNGELTQSGVSSSVARVFSLVGYVLAVAIPAMAIFVAVSAEQWFFRVVDVTIPTVEGMDSVGQWGVWAATGIVLVATLLNASREGMGAAGGASPVVAETSPEIIKV